MKQHIYSIIFLIMVGCAPSRHIVNEHVLDFPSEIKYAKTYGGHLQGFTTDYQSFLYWSHTTQLVKTDFRENIVKVIDVSSHHGDPEYYNGRIYVAVNLGLFNEEPGLADSWVYVYDAKDLGFIKKYSVPEVIHGAGGIAIHDKKVMIVGGLPGSGKYSKNPVYEYNLDFELQKVHWLESGYTYKGIQIATYYNGYWYFGCYGNAGKSLNPVVLKTMLVDGNLQLTKIYDLDFSHGMIGLSGNRWLVSNKTFDKMAKAVEFGE
ncbi:MAG: hypothetical protein A2W90_23670 [Bacteroidetes bacterium GWF2_42_66]|nr:MAG: hypothetical protein A2W92_19935 [Bacteroidetes bacterium GWA2_42_15]OFY00310.1 MAG: hypothetical protein A2W89_13995 [Bacteroidetes bacterium GWE2_42_39]OFY47119.1 MAG: hypothetical protein A2W90_23670 [Bacteroidetes bacterium GWF2_42_66]HBL76702.1 hypothetical protein [Prolixibacteraceae bacterium]HCR91760.1 hypothetical protein [Prolixibacteraceae bacterium]